MKTSTQRLFEHLQGMLRHFRQREAARREFLRAVYGEPKGLDFDYEKPAYLRRARIVSAS